MKTSLLFLTLALSVSAQAKTKAIRIDPILSYPSPASVHFNGIQHDLAKKAIEACGGEDNVLDITDINFSVKKGIPGAATGAIEKGEFQLSLQLNYPKLAANALVKCKD